MVSGADDETLIIWSLATFTCQFVLHGHTGAISCLAITTDGQYVISGSHDRSIRIWSITTGSLLQQLEGHSDIVQYLAVTTDGQSIVSGSRDKTLRVWSLHNGDCKHVLQGHDEEITGMILGDNNKWIISSSQDTTLRRWSLHTGTCQHVFRGHQGSVDCFALNQVEQWIVSGSQDKTLRVWSITTGECQHILSGHQRKINCVALSTDGQRVISGSEDKVLKLWEINSLALSLGQGLPPATLQLYETTFEDVQGMTAQQQQLLGQHDALNKTLAKIGLQEALKLDNAQSIHYYLSRFPALLVESFEPRKTILHLLIEQGKRALQGIPKLNDAQSRRFFESKDFISLKQLPLPSGNLLLVELAKCDQPWLIMYCIQYKNCNINDIDGHGLSALMAAAQAGQLHIVEKLIAAHADIVLSNSEGLTAVMFAVLGNHLSVLQLLISTHTDTDIINVAENNKVTPLMMAAAEGNLSIVHLLLEHGAVVEKTDQDNHSALVFAAKKGADEILALLLMQKGMCDNVAQKEIALRHAVRAGQLKVVEMLLSEGVNANAIRWGDKTLLMLAAEKGYKEIVATLILAGAHINAINRLDGTTALFYATVAGYVEIITILNAAGATPLTTQLRSKLNKELRQSSSSSCRLSATKLIQSSDTVTIANEDWPLQENKFGDLAVPAPLKALYDRYLNAHQQPHVAQGLAYYIFPSVTLSFQGTEQHDLMAWLDGFLNNQNGTILLLHGDSGRGKTLFTRKIEQRLWQHINYADERPKVALLIELRLLHGVARDNIVEHVLQECGYIAEQIKYLQKNYCFVFIFDGYDELPVSLQRIAFYQDNFLKNWQDCLVIVTSRPQYFNHIPQYRSLFMVNPSVPASLTELYLTVFSETQIDDYLQRYIVDKDTNTDWRDYKKQLQSLKDVHELVKSPLLLRIVADILPELHAFKLKKSQSSSFSRITRAEVYQMFVKKWFIREGIRLRTYDDQIPDDFNDQLEFGHFSECLAFMMFLNGVVSAGLHFQNENWFQKRLAGDKTRSNPWENFFSRLDNEIVRKRAGCPLRLEGKNNYSFVHKSFMEYFVAQYLAKEFAITSTTFLDFNDGELLSALRSSALNQRRLNAEPAIIAFLVDLTQITPNASLHWLNIVFASRHKPDLGIAGANAMTILSQSKMHPLTGIDFSHVEIPGAILSDTVLDWVNFFDANLTGIQLQGAWLRQVNFTSARLGDLPAEGIDDPLITTFGENAHLQKDELIVAIAYSHDNCWIATGSISGCVELHDRETGTIIYTTRLHTDRILSLEFSADNKILLSASLDKTVKKLVVEKNSWSPHLVFELQDVVGSCFSLNQQWIAIGSRQNGILIFRCTDNQPSLTLKNKNESDVCSLCFAPDSITIAVGYANGSILLWDVASQTVKQTLLGHQGAVLSLSFSKTGDELASGGSDHLIYIWELSSNTYRLQMKGHTDKVTTVCLSPDGAELATGSADNTARLWETATGNNHFTSRIQMFGVACVRFSPNSLELATDGFDKTVRLWDVASCQTRLLLEGHSQLVNNTRFSDSGAVLVSSSADCSIRTWNIDKGTTNFVLSSLDVQEVNAIDISSDDTQLASIGKDHALRLWNLPTGSLKHTFFGAGKNSVCFTKKNNEMVTDGFDGTLQIWHPAQNEKPIASLTGHVAEVTTLVSTKWDSIISASHDKTIRLWSPVQRACLQVLDFHTDVMHVIASGKQNKFVLGSNAGGSIHLWLQQGENYAFSSTLLSSKAAVLSASFSTNGNELAVGYRDSVLRILDTTTGSCLHELGHRSPVFSVCWSNNAIVTGSADDSVKLWQRCRTYAGEQWALIWSTPQYRLFCTGCVITNTKDLSSKNKRLLKQRGAAEEESVRFCRKFF